MAQSLSSVNSQRRTSKHDLFLEYMPTMESQLEPNLAAFTMLQALCVGQGILPRPSGAVPAKDGESVSSGMSVREFLDIVADKIHNDEVVYDKFAHVLSIALGQDSLHVVLREATSYPARVDDVAADQASNTSDTDTVPSDVFPIGEEPEHNADGDIGLPDELADPVDPINAVREPVGAMVLGDRNVVRNRNVCRRSEIYSASMFKDLSTAAKHDRETRRVLESDLSKESRKNEALKNDVERLNGEKEHAFQEFLRLSRERDVEREKHECHMTELKTSIAEREVEVNELRKERQECEMLIKSQSEKIDNQKSKTNFLERDVVDLKQKLEELKKHKAEVQNNLRAKNLELNELTEERDQLIIQQGVIVKGLSEEISQCKKRIEELICQLLKEKEKCSRQSEEIEELRIIERLYREDKCFVLSFLALMVAAFCLIVFVSLYAWLFS